MDASESGTCPKCGQPRLAEALDCPYCGVVYARWRGAGAPPAAVAAAGAGAAAAAVADDPAPGAVGDLYTPQPEDFAPPKWVGADEGAARETLLGRNLGYSLLGAGVVFLLLHGFWISVMFGASTNLDTARTQFQRLSGFVPPPECDEAVIFTVAGRRFVMIEQGDEPEERLAMTALLFHPGGLGEEVPAELLLERVRGRLEALGIPYHQVRSRSVTVEGSPATAVTWGLGPEERELARVWALAFRARDGKQALVVLAGPTTRVAVLSRRWLLG